MGVSLEELERAWPEGGLFEGKRWVFSPEPLRLEAGLMRELERMGPVLAAFQAAQDRIYRRSAKGKVAPWVAEALDAGKPEWMVAWQREGAQAEVVPRVIRPDLLLTEEGFLITELDSVPGGMGVTGWLGEVYGDEVVGGRGGMVAGLAGILPEGGAIWVSEEAGDYRPEMQWLAGKLGVEVKWGEEWAGEAGYRFFELFDWEAIASLREGEKGGLTPPVKPLFEEKMWLGLLWSPGLRKVWEQELRGKQYELLKKWIPRGIPVDATPLPANAELAGLGVNSWEEVGRMSQKERRLVLKISGFSELAWGSRGVFIGHDESGEQWGELVGAAVEQWGSQPWVMQEFREAKLVEHPYFDEAGEVQLMKGRARLCPYYFVGDREVKLGGCLATIVPADKKKIHGMEDAILVPVAGE
ncbi:MAG: hypothetical protein AAGC74_10910 [Verrucomicrobiota bacterium]